MKLLSKALLALSLLTYSALAAINLNTATKEELMSLDGIGESKAEAIIEYRKTNKFNSVEDLKNVKGIGDKTFENLKKDISISGKTTLPEGKDIKSKAKSETNKMKDKAENNTDEVKTKAVDKVKSKDKELKKNAKEKTDNLKNKTSKAANDISNKGKEAI